MLRVVVLGAAAGGGVPQWNCGCAICRTARHDQPQLRSTQSSIAFSVDDAHWFLINASPDLRQQLTDTPRLHPREGQLRHTPVRRRQLRGRCRHSLHTHLPGLNRACARPQGQILPLWTAGEARFLYGAADCTGRPEG